MSLCIGVLVASHRFQICFCQINLSKSKRIFQLSLFIDDFKKRSKNGVKTLVWMIAGQSVSGRWNGRVLQHHLKDENFFDGSPCMAPLRHPLRTQSGLRPNLLHSCRFGRSELQSLVACLWRSLGLGLQCLPSLRWRHYNDIESLLVTG